MDFCKARGLGADFNPTFFSHPKCDPLTLASPNEETRKFWVEHGKACIESKVFGIGVEAYTVGSAEFALSYAAFNRKSAFR